MFRKQLKRRFAILLINRDIIQALLFFVSSKCEEGIFFQIYSTQTGLYNGAMYRVFGTFASGNTAEYASRVIVSDNYGYSFTLVFFIYYGNVLHREEMRRWNSFSD